MQLRREAIPDLLNALDAAVIRGGPAGFEGKVAVGVEVSPERALWWVAELGVHPATSFTADVPVDADAALFMGGDEATALLERGDARASEGARFATFGEVELLKRMLERYLNHRSPIAARISQQAGPGRSR
jgi:hypothetical protein